MMSVIASTPPVYVAPPSTSPVAAPSQQQPQQASEPTNANLNAPALYTGIADASASIVRGSAINMVV